MKKPVQLKHELFIIFNTFYLFLIDESVMYFANQRIFHTSLIQTSFIFAIQINRLLFRINWKSNKVMVKFIK